MNRYDAESLRRAATGVRAVHVDDVIDLPDHLDDDEFMASDEAVSAGEAANPNAADPRLRGQAQRLLGVLALAPEDLVAMIDNDLRELRGGTPSHDEECILALWRLPPQFLCRYDAAFTKRFLAAVDDLRERLARSPWEPPSCVAQELGSRLVLDHAEMCVDLYGVDLVDDWRPRLEERLFLDLDHEFLYDPEFDGFEQDPDFLPHLRLAPMRLRHGSTRSRSSPRRRGVYPDWYPRPRARGRDGRDGLRHAGDVRAGEVASGGTG